VTTNGNEQARHANTVEFRLDRAPRPAETSSHGGGRENVGIHADAEARCGLSGDEAPAYGRVARRAARILLTVAAVAIFPHLWGVNLFDLEGGGIAERPLSTLVDVGL
jgi:hypothetical protein